MPSTGHGSEFKYLSKEEKIGLDNFENFRDAFTKAKVTRIARKQEKLSTQDPVPFLIEAYQAKPKPKVESKLPDYLQVSKYLCWSATFKFLHY